MNRIIEVDERLGYAIVEPGVTFFQLYDFLAQKEIKLWLSTPAPGWGSIIGNALERGVGYTPYGDHAGMQCGMEAVLANGNVVRTGMGAKAGNSTWALYEYGFGPSWDKVFTQSNFGVVTKMGIWLMPEPEATANVSITVPNAADLPTIIDVLRPLRIGQAINSNPVIANAIRRLAATSIRSDWYDGDGAMPEEMLAEIMRRNGWNFWEVTIPFYDSEAVIDARVETVRKAFSSIAGATFEVKRWRRGEPLSGSAARIPNLNAYMILNWRGGKGAHISFAPVCAMTGTEANRIYGLMNQRVREFGFDYYGGFTLFQRHMVHTALIVFDAADQKMANDAYRLFATVVREAADLGFVEYRAHVDFMDHIADAYDYNNHALMKLNETVKDALDPDGILAPGKQGIWPARLRTQRK